MFFVSRVCACGRAPPEENRTRADALIDFGLCGGPRFFLKIQRINQQRNPNNVLAGFNQRRLQMARCRCLRGTCAAETQHKQPDL